MRQVAIFVPRPLLHDDIKATFHDRPRGSHARQRIVVVHGLGGSGKSQLVLNYIQEFRNEYSGVFWINATRRDTVEQHYTQIYCLLFGLLTTTDENIPKIDDLILAVQQWFVRQPGNYVLVFDGADDIDDPGNPSYFDLTKFIPKWHSVDVLITTRIATVQRLGSAAVEVREMEKDEALELFFSSSGLRSVSLPLIQVDEARKIVEELGHLALAVTLAGSHVSNFSRIQSDLDEYLPEYRDRREALLSEMPSKLLDQYEASVLTTWETSFRAVKGRSPIAAKLLTFLAFLDSTDIFPELFDNLMYDDVQALREDGKTTTLSEDNSSNNTLARNDLEQAFAVLKSFSFLKWMSDQSSFSMHKLVHAWSYDRLLWHEKVNLIRATVQYLCGKLFYVPDSPKEK